MMRIFEVNLRNYSIEVMNIKDLNDEQIEEIFNLLISNNQIDTNIEDFKRKIEACSVAYYKGEIVGFRAIKQPNKPYVEIVFSKAGVENLIDNDLLELGYLFVKENHRNTGLASMMIKKLLNFQNYRNKKLFATTKSNNKKVKTMLVQNGFEQVGSSYQSRLGSGTLELYINFL